MSGLVSLFSQCCRRPLLCAVVVLGSSGSALASSTTACCTAPSSYCADVSPLSGADVLVNKEHASSKILGCWKDEDQGAVVEVTQKNGVFVGRLISTPHREVKLGIAIFRGLKFDAAENRWVGRVYAPRRDSTYNATFQVKGNILKMKVTFGLLWKNVKWYQVS